MRKKIIPYLIMGLLITTTSLPVLAESTQYGGSVQKEYTTLGKGDVTLDVAITTDWVIDWQNHGLLIREFPLDGEVWAYHEISGDDLYGLYFEQVWWYDNGTGLENKWSWAWTITEHWTSAATWSWWQIGLDYEKGVGIVECLIDNESLGYTNWFAIDNTQPNEPTIEGETEGKIGEEYEYEFEATDPDGFEISYFVDWGDDTNSGWTDFVPSGTMETLSHTWDEQGDYTIGCKVRDLAHNESDWATLDINMPIDRALDFNSNIFEWLFNRFPNAFPVLRHLLGL